MGVLKFILFTIFTLHFASTGVNARLVQQFQKENILSNVALDKHEQLTYKLFRHKRDEPDKEPEGDAKPVAGLQEEDFTITALNLHNKHRANHGAPPVTLDPKLTQESQSWADHIVNTNAKLGFKTSSTSIQNIFEFGGTGKTKSDIITMAIGSWYNGKSKYDPKSPKTTYGTFTVMVWKATKTIGVGVATKGSRSVAVVAYSPPGNMFFSGKDPDQFFHKNVQL